MENENNTAGKSTRDMASNRRKSAIWIGLIGLALFSVVELGIKYSDTLKLDSAIVGVLFFALIFLPSFIRIALKLQLRKVKRAYRGARGEELVGNLLAELSSEYYVLNDIESPYGNIDHIVIDKSGGIFLIETKAHGGKVVVDRETLLVNGKMPEKNFIGQVLQNSYWLRDRVGELLGTKPWITGFLVFTNAFVVPGKPVKGVTILNRKYLAAAIKNAGKHTSLPSPIWEHREELSKILRKNE